MIKRMSSAQTKIAYWKLWKSEQRRMSNVIQILSIKHNPNKKQCLSVYRILANQLEYTREEVVKKELVVIKVLAYQQYYQTGMIALVCRKGKN